MKRGEYTTNSQSIKAKDESQGTGIAVSAGLCLGVAGSVSGDERSVTSLKENPLAMKTYRDFDNGKEDKEEDDEDDEKSCCNNCMTCCCQAHTCVSFRSLKTAPRLYLNGRLEKAKSFSFKKVRNVIIDAFKLTPLGGFISDMIKYGTMLILLILLIPSCLEFNKKRDILSFLGLIFAGVAFLYEVIDLIHYIWSNRCSAFYNSFKWLANFKENMEDFKEKRKNQNPEDIEAQSNKPNNPDNCCQEMCRCCPVQCTFIVDFIRILMSSLWFYPILLVNIFQLIEEYVNNDSSAEKVGIMTWLTNAASFGYTVFSIYISRMIILAHATWALKKVQDIKLTEGAFQVIFSVYTGLQMVLQMFMIFAIGARYHNEYKHCKSTTDPEPTDDSMSPGSCNFKISIFLWYMMYLAYILPIISTVMFFLVHHYWTQKFFLTFYYNILQILKKPSMTEVVKGREQKTENLNLQGIINFEKDYQEYKNKNFCQKFMYPFTSPFHVIVCLLYAGHLLAFVICFLVDLPELSTGWYIFAAVGFAFGILINLYAVTVAFIYLVIIVTVLLCIVIIFLLLMLNACTEYKDPGPANPNRV